MVMNLPYHRICVIVKDIKNNNKVLEDIKENRSDREAFNTLPKTSA